MTTEHEQAATSVQLREAHEELAAYLDAHEQQYPRADRLSVHVNCYDLDAWQSALAFADAELAALRPLRAAALRYGRALQQVRARGGSIVDAVGYDEWCEALEAVEALALALAAAEGQG